MRAQPKYPAPSARRTQPCKRPREKPGRYLIHAGPEPLHGLGNVGLAAFRSNRQGAQDFQLRVFWEVLKVLTGRLDPRDKPCISYHA